MNLDDEFDRIARDKAGERHVPFAEADWQAMQQLLEQERRHRGAHWWWTLAAVVLLGIGGGAWWLVGGGASDAPAHDRSSVEKVNESAEVATSQQAVVNTTPVDGTAGSAPEPAIAAEVTPTASSISAPRSREPGRHSAGTTGPAQVPAAKAGSYAGSDAANASAPPSERPAMGNDPQGATTTTNPGPGGVGAVTGSSVASSSAASGERPAPSATGAEGQAGTTPDTAPTMAITSDTVPPPTIAAADAPAVPDTATTSALPTAVPARFDEFVLSIGALRTRTSYSGVASEQWAPTISDAWTPSFGLEWMRQHTRFGFGTGLNYSTYSEHVLQQEAYATSIQYSYLHSFLEVDTMVTVVVDTVVQDGQVYYVTQQVPTSVLVLETNVDTTTATARTQEAVDQYNRVSYVEVPVLGEVHWGTGHWRLGVQAGPMIGFKTTARGSLPYGPADGYVDLSDQPLREVMFGYTARVYLRWLPGDRFSFGIAPGVRGQLGNAYSEGDVSRSSMGLGGSFQVAYHLP